jgi:probable rRNA maturation factor
VYLSKTIFLPILACLKALFLGTFMNIQSLCYNTDMIELDNRTDKTYNFPLLEEIADYLTDQEIELILTDNAEIAEINREFRGIDKATDVLSFPSDPFPGAPIGSIVISVDKVASVAQELGHSDDDEIALLFIHGLLHLKGFDHEVDSGEMRQKEVELIEKFNLPKSLIVRTLEE